MTGVYILLGGILVAQIAILRKLNRLTEPQPEEGELEIMYIVKNDHPPVRYSISPGKVTDAEGEEITDPKVLATLKTVVESSNPDVLPVTPDADPKTGEVAFGRSGQADFHIRIEDAGGRVLAVGGDSFLVTTGDPAAVDNVGVAFEGLTREPDAPPPDGSGEGGGDTTNSTGVVTGERGGNG